MSHVLSDKQKRIRDFLSKNPIGVLSTVTPDGDPHGAVIYFVLDEDFTASFLTRSGTRKSDNIKHQEHVTLTVYEPKSQTTAQIVGHATEITDNDTVNSIASEVLKVSLKTSEAGIPPITKLEAGSYNAFSIQPVQINMAVYKKPDSGGYTQLFDSIESFNLKEEAK